MEMHAGLNMQEQAKKIFRKHGQRIEFDRPDKRLRTMDQVDKEHQITKSCFL